jgi:TnpA family transposase
MTMIERIAWETRLRAENKIFKMLISSLSTEQFEKLDHLLSVMPQSSKTYLAWLREIPGTISSDSFLSVAEKLDYIRRLQLQIDTKGIHPNRLRQLLELEHDMSLILSVGLTIRKSTLFWLSISLNSYKI